MSIKVVLGSEVRRISGQPTDLKGLRALLESTLKGNLPGQYHIKYQDPDGDLITVDTEEDFKFMMDILKGSLKVFVLAKDAVAKEAAPAPEPPKEEGGVNKEVAAPELPKIEKPAPASEELEKQEKLKKLQGEVKMLREGVKVVKCELHDAKLNRIQIQKKLLELEISALDLEKATLAPELPKEKLAELKSKQEPLKSAKKFLKGELAKAVAKANEVREKKRGLEKQIEGLQAQIKSGDAPKAEEAKPAVNPELEAFERRCKVFAEFFPTWKFENVQAVLKEHPHFTDDEVYDVFAAITAKQK
jgi:hypothetical protein